MKTMKIKAAVVLSVFADCVFALTETVNGIEWNYYINSEGNAIIERSDVRDELVNSYLHIPAAHTGTDASIFKIPKMLGGRTVTTIGLVAIQTGKFTSPPKVILIPDVITHITECSFVHDVNRSDSYGQGNASSNPLVFVKYWGLPRADLLFTGDKPTIDSTLPTSWKYSRQVGGETYYYKRVHCYDRSDYSTAITYNWEEVDMYVVEGTSGWELRDRSYAGYGYGFVKYGAAKVDMSPSDGVLGSPKIVSLTCPNASAKIYYTLDGSEPTTNQTANCFLYRAPIEIQANTVVKTLAHVEEYPYTVTYEKKFALGQIAPLAITASQERFNWTGNMVTLSCETSGAQIHYTLNGSEPTEESLLYTGPFAINDTTTVKAKAFKEDWFESETATANFAREWYTVETPIIEPGDTTFPNASQEVSISCGTEDAMILYTTDGSDPAANGREYKRPFKVYNTCTVRTVAVKYDWKNSDEAIATMTRGEPLSEAANLFGYKMGTDADKPWVVDTAVSHDGVSSIRSNGDGSYVQTSVNGRGTLSFWWRAMCEEPGYEWYDHGAFVTGGDTVTRIAGEDTGWVYYSMRFSTLGKHVLRWEYNKDEEGDFAPDCVWLDQVQWIPADGSGYTLTTPEPVPYSWLTEYNLGVVEGDFEAAANAANGKTSLGRPMSVWQDYVAGTDPTNAASRFSANIDMRGATPLVAWEPNLNEDGVTRRVYKVHGSETLEDGGNWQYPTNSLHRFFRVSVEMP